MAIKHYFQPWVLITIGILMNIISAIVTHYFISENNAQIHLIEQKVMAIDSNIDTQWQAKNEMERKKEFILLLLNSQEKQSIKPSIKRYLQHYIITLQQQYLGVKNKIGSAISIESTIKMTSLAQNKVINDINNQYLEKLELESLQQPIKDKNAMLYSIAIFMQLIGLILVLSRDLARK